MLSWFTNVNAMALRMRQLEARIEELENLYGGSSQPMPTRVIHAAAPVAPPQPAAPPQQNPKANTKKAEKKERKPRRVRSLTDHLRSGETLVARVPIGNRQFEEVDILYENDTFTVMGQDISNTNLNKVVQLVAKTLEDEGIRDKECKSPLNAWLLCSVERHGKRVLLDKLEAITTGVVEEAEDATEEAEEEAEEAEENHA
jgi:hypothetical protein